MTRHAKLKAVATVAALAALAGSASAQVLPHSYGTTLDANSPTFNRPLSGNPPTSLSGVGTSVSFGTFIFVPDTSGSFTLETTAATLTGGPGNEAADDTFLALYQGIFTPATPLTNILQSDDDGASTGFLSSMTRNLTAGTSYTLVTTTFGNGQFGSITTRISGPGTLNPAAAPEPGSVALLGLAALPGVALLRRRSHA
jgi:hypothetical protein